MSDKLTAQEVRDKLAEVDRLLDEVARGSVGFVNWSGPAYGMGGWVESGEWNASSVSC